MMSLSSESIDGQPRGIMLPTPSLHFPYGRRFLAFAGTNIIQPGAANAPLLLPLDLRNARRMQQENSLHALTVGNAAHGKCFVQPAAFAPDDDSSEYLDSFF